MNTTLLTAELGTTSSVTMYTTDDEKILPDKRNKVIGTTLALTATTAIGQSMNVNGERKIYEKYASAYVESMTDEELEIALQKMDLLIADEQNNEQTKTI